MHLIVFKIVTDEVNEIYAATLFTKMISRDLSILQSTNNIDNRKLRFTDIPDLPLLFWSLKTRGKSGFKFCT